MLVLILMVEAVSIVKVILGKFAGENRYGVAWT